jgi:hypothetical protein
LRRHYFKYQLKKAIAGGMASGVTYLLDGAVHNNPMNSSALPVPFPDTLQEFKVETSATGAQSGEHAGGSVSLVTRLFRTKCFSSPVSRKRLCARTARRGPVPPSRNSPKDIGRRTGGRAGLPGEHSCPAAQQHSAAE